MAEPLKNIAFVGATGYVGKPTLRALASNGLHNISVISRTSSKSKIPEYEGVKTRFGDYDDEAFMQSVLSGQDVLIIMLAFLAMGQQDKLITAAAKAGVKYIIPSEYMLDTSNSRLCEAVPLMKKCQKDHERIQILGMKHISVVCNLWLDFTLERGQAGFNYAERKASLCIDSAPYNLSTTTQVGAGIAAMLSLPQSRIDAEFANSCLYISSFRLTHEELFQAILRVSGTKETDWTIERLSFRDVMRQGTEKLEKNDRSGMIDLFVGSLFTPDLGGDLSAKAHNGMLGLRQEDLDRTVQAALAH